MKVFKFIKSYLVFVLARYYKVLKIKFTLQFQCHDSSESTDENMDMVWSKCGKEK